MVTFVEVYNGRSVILPELWSSSDKKLLFTDASCALSVGKNCSDLSWEKVQDLAQYQIAVKELFPIVLALEMLGFALADKKILFMTDDMATVHVINKQNCND